MTAPPFSQIDDVILVKQRYMLSAVCGRSTYNVGRNRRAVPTHAGAASSEHAGAVQRLPDYDHRHHCRPERAAQACTHAMGWYGPPALTEPVQLISTCAAPVLAVLTPGGAVKLLAYASAAILHTVT